MSACSLKILPGSGIDMRLPAAGDANGGSVMLLDIQPTFSLTSGSDTFVIAPEASITSSLINGPVRHIVGAFTGLQLGMKILPPQEGNLVTMFGAGAFFDALGAEGRRGLYLGPKVQFGFGIDDSRHATAFSFAPRFTIIPDSRDCALLLMLGFGIDLFAHRPEDR